MNKRWRKIIVYVFLPIAILGGIFYWLNWTGSTKDIESVANQFKPDVSWQLKEERIQPPRNWCLNDAPCPSLSKNWHIGHNISLTEFQEMLASAGWNFKIDRECNTSNLASGSGSTICSAKGIHDGYSISLSTEGTSEGDNIRLVLYIKEK